VRGGQSPSQNFIDNGDGTVTDNRTELIWQQGEPGFMAWDSALSYCEGLSLGGHSDWRLPNIKELESITDDTRWNPAIDTAYFPNASAAFYWSSTTGPYDPDYAWVVVCDQGHVGDDGKGDYNYVRCVRGGQSGLIDLPRTGQTKCYDSAGTEISCAGTGQDGEIQAGIAWPDPRFTITYCDGNGPCANQSSDCDQNPSTDVVTDNLTGLMWARNGNLPNGKMTWYPAIDYANNLNLSGHSDWRFSNVNELDSLRNADEPNTATWLNNTQVFNSARTITGHLLRSLALRTTHGPSICGMVTWPYSITATFSTYGRCVPDSMTLLILTILPTSGRQAKP